MRENVSNHHERVVGLELYNAVYQLISDWAGRDASRQTQELPQLVQRIVQLVEGHDFRVAQVAAHDDSEAA